MMKQSSLSFLFVSLQLDPQTVQSKNWHMDVIEMNGVLISFSLNILILFALLHCIHSKKCWVVLAQFWVKYGQTQPLGNIFK